LKPGGVVIAWVEHDELMNTIASVFPYVRQECGIFLLASERPIQDYRDVEAIIRTNMPEHGQKSIGERRKLCPPENKDIAFAPTNPILTDKRPLLEYHLGRY
jgi:hypothetical protein